MISKCSIFDGNQVFNFGWQCTSGAKADDKTVFEALSPALNDDFSDYSGHLSEGLNHHNLTTRSEIFQKLRDTYEAYEMDLLEQRKNR